jgi:hypothetical protein
MGHRHFDSINVVDKPSSTVPILDARRGGFPLLCLSLAGKTAQRHPFLRPPLFALLRVAGKHHLLGSLAKHECRYAIRHRRVFLDDRMP